MRIFRSIIQYNTVMSIAIMIPLVVLSGELNDIFSTVWFWDEFGFWLQMVITSLTGFSVNAAMILLMMYTSPLSVTVASTSKVRHVWIFRMGSKCTKPVLI